MALDGTLYVEQELDGDVLARLSQDGRLPLRYVQEVEVSPLQAFLSRRRQEAEGVLRPEGAGDNAEERLLPPGRCPSVALVLEVLASFLCTLPLCLGVSVPKGGRSAFALTSLRPLFLASS